MRRGIVEWQNNLLLVNVLWVLQIKWPEPEGCSDFCGSRVSGSMVRCQFLLLFLGLSYMGKILVFNTHTPKLLLSRAIWEPSTWPVRPLVKEHNWGAFLAPCLGNLWWMSQQQWHTRSPSWWRRTWPPGAKDLLFAFRKHRTPQCCECPESWCRGEQTAIQGGACFCVWSMCVMKGGYPARSPPGHGRNEKLLEGALSFVGIALKRKIDKCRKLGGSPVR